MPTDTLQDSYQAAVTLDAEKIESALRESLGDEIMSSLLEDLPDAKPSPQDVWSDDPAGNDDTEMSVAKRNRLITAYRAYRLARLTDRPGIARNWFVAANPHLGEDSPVAALITGASPSAVLLAAERFDPRE